MRDQKLSGKEMNILFCIAGHIMEVVFPSTLDWEQLLPSFKPFRCNIPDINDIICSIYIVEKKIDTDLSSSKLRYQVSGHFGHLFSLMETEHNYISDVQFVENGNYYRMKSKKDFTASTVYIDWDYEYAGTILSSFLMIAYTMSTIIHNILMIHASVVEKDGYAYAFLGKSGTGKSTHSALWQTHIEGVELLNDDNPAIRIEKNGCIYVYGTPWSGKTPCYKNRKVLLKAFVRLNQASTNRFTWKEGVDALITLLPGCSSMRWNTLLYNEMCNSLEKVIVSVKTGCLDCLPNKEAALLCYEEMKKI